MNDAKLFCCVAKGSTARRHRDPSPPPTSRPTVRLDQARLDLLRGEESRRDHAAALQWGVALAGILSALALHFGIKSSSRRRTASGSFLSGVRCDPVESEGFIRLVDGIAEHHEISALAWASLAWSSELVGFSRRGRARRLDDLASIFRQLQGVEPGRELAQQTRGS